MRVVVTGAGGQLGHDLGTAFAHDELTALDREALDVSDEPAVWTAIGALAPEVVVNAAAYTRVDACESDPEPAWIVNAGGAANLARACHAAGALLVHLSTDYVFDGTLDRPYTEFDRPAPRSVYGRTKEAGEQLVREYCRDHQIVRTAWLQGAHGANFVKTMLRLGRERGAARVVTDQLGNPTFAADLGPAIRRLAAIRRPGTYHLTNSGSCTWFELAAEVFRLVDLHVELGETDTATFAAPAPRPANSRLEGRNTRLAGLDPLPHWRDGLARLLGELEG